jgi:ABC-type dipeptide/oligopeptide/nickel transport system permease subunit
MTIAPASLTEAAPVGGPGGVAFHRTRILQLPRSPKVIAGLIILGIFGVVALLGRWAAPYSPNATDEQNWVRHVLVD